MDYLVGLTEWIDRFNRAIGQFVSWITLFMVLATTLTVIQRYLFASNYVWESELIIFAHALVFLAASGYTLQENKHVRVDILYERMSPAKKALFDILGTLLFLVPVVSAIAYFSADFIISSWQILEKSRESSGLPIIYVLKSFIWLFCFTLITQAISLTLKNIAVLKKS